MSLQILTIVFLAADQWQSGEMIFYSTCNQCWRKIATVWLRSILQSQASCNFRHVPGRYAKRSSLAAGYSLTLNGQTREWYRSSHFTLPFYSENVTNFLFKTNTDLCKKKGGGWMCTWGVKGRWRGGVAHHSFCQEVVIRVSVVGSEERVS